MKNTLLKQILVLITLTTIQACVPAATEEAATEDKTEFCNEVLGCSWIPEDEDLKWEGCMQDLAADLIDANYTCELLGTGIICDYPEGLSEQTAIDDALSLLIKLNAQFGWRVLVKNQLPTSRFNVSSGTEWVSRNGKISTTIANQDPTNITIKDCPEIQ